MEVLIVINRYDLMSKLYSLLTFFYSVIKFFESKFSLQTKMPFSIFLDALNQFKTAIEQSL